MLALGKKNGVMVGPIVQVRRGGFQDLNLKDIEKSEGVLLGSGDSLLYVTLFLKNSKKLEREVRREG